MQWSDAGLDRALVDRIVATGAADVPIVNMTSVQKQMLRADSKSDIFALSPTGSGKTIAFLATAMRDVMVNNGDGILVLSSTNPLRLQHHRVASQICPPTAQVVNVETASKETLGKLTSHAGASVIVSTPAKWLDLMKPAKVGADEAKQAQRYASERLTMIVLDEVDEMVRNPGFKKDVEILIKASPNARVVSTTATGSPEARDFATRVAREATIPRPLVEIEASTGVGSPQPGSQSHTHHLVSVEAEKLLATMATLLTQELASPETKAVVFFPTAMMADFARTYLQKTTKLRDIHLLHSKLPSGAVRKAETQFRGCRPCALLASNIMARGMDVPDINLVIQVGVSSPEEYKQRVGRSGRAGRSGRGILLVSDAESKQMSAAIAKQGIEFEPKSVDETEPTGAEDPGTGPTKAFWPGQASSGSAVGTLRGSAQAFKATLGAYKTHARMLDFSMRDAVSLLKRVFTGAGQAVPTITRKNAQKLGLRDDDGLEIVDGAAPNRHGKYHRRGGGAQMGLEERTSFGGYGVGAVAVAITAVVSMAPTIYV